MTREAAASHDLVVLTCPHIGAALAIHRVAPALSLVELLKRPAQLGLVRGIGCARPKWGPTT
jgi:hypothetical protein